MIDEENRTLWCGNLPEQATEELVYELFFQAGPLKKVRIARDRDGRQKNFAFITYCHEVSIPYAINLFRGTALYHKTISLQCRGRTALLPPPIRYTGPDPSIEFNQDNVQQFADMTAQLKEDDFKMTQGPRGQDDGDKLIMASLQGNWQAHRHHPYRPKDNGHNYQPTDRDIHNDRGKSAGNSNWRDRRNLNHKRANYHRSD